MLNGKLSNGRKFDTTIHEMSLHGQQGNSKNSSVPSPTQGKCGLNNNNLLYITLQLALKNIETLRKKKSLLAIENSPSETCIFKFKTKMFFCLEDGKYNHTCLGVILTLLV
jgi:hypothetical protein